MGEPVASVGRRDPDVGYGHDVVTEVERAVIIDGDRVVGQDAAVLGGVEAAVAGHDLADSYELAGIVDAIAHERSEIPRAVETGDLGAGAIGVLAHTDA